MVLHEGREGNKVKLFSERMEYTSAKNVQKKAIDDDLRNGLWNMLYVRYFVTAKTLSFESEQRILFLSLWAHHFKLPIDRLPPSKDSIVEEIRKHFYSCRWHEIYSLIEAVLIFVADEEVNSNFIRDCNQILQREMSAYRISNNRVVPITSEYELEAVEKALGTSHNPVKQHLAQALELFSNRHNPDFRNSIKESISAVEVLVKRISGEPKLKFAQAVDRLKDNKIIGLHPAIAESFKKLYGWTSNDAGIRHGNIGESNVDQEDACFMLVTCSAIVNFLTVKADKAGIDLRQ